MDSATQEVVVRTRTVMAYQLGIGVVTAVGFYLGMGAWAGQSSLYGSAIGLVSALLLGRGIARAAHQVQQQPKHSMRTLYIGAVQRFVVVLALFVVGLAGLKLDPLATVVGFALAQLAYILAIRTQRIKDTGTMRRPQ